MLHVRQEKPVLHATEALHDFCVTCNTSRSGGIFSEVVSFDFAVECHTIYPQQPGCFCFVPGGLIQGFKNCMRIDRLCLIGRAALDSLSAHELGRQMIEGDDVLAAKDEGMFHGVLELPHIAGPGILEKGFRNIGGYRFNGFLEFSVEPIAKVFNQKRDVFAPVP